MIEEKIDTNIPIEMKPRSALYMDYVKPSRQASKQPIQTHINSLVDFFLIYPHIRVGRWLRDMGRGVCVSE